MVYTFKLCLLGDGAVGKTALRERFLGKAFNQSYLMTIGADFALKHLKIEENDVRLQVWDLAGQPRFRNVRHLYYRGSYGNLVVFDLTRRGTLENIPNWISESHKSLKSHVPYVLLGNKSDLRNPSSPDHVTDAEALKTAEELSKIAGMPIKYFTTSAKTGSNVDTAFEHLTASILSSKE